MEEGLIKITPNKEKARSILKMADTTIDMINIIDVGKFSSNITKEYYDVIRELLSVVLLLDGYKIYGEGAHKKQIEYVQDNYKEFGGYEISLLEDLRIKRNKIAYDGFFVDKDYIGRRIKDIQGIIQKLREIIGEKIGNDNMAKCDECNRGYEFNELKFKDDKNFKGCKEFYCPNDHLLGTMHMQCRMPLKATDEHEETKYVCSKCKRLFSIENKK